jgi:hypothetical protein
MEAKNDGGKLFTGPQANVVADASNFLASLGLLSKPNITRLTDSVAYGKYAKDLVMQDLDGKLGGNVSNSDVKYIEARIPQLTTNPEARKELIAKLKEIHQKRIDRYRKMNSHANKAGQLNDFDFGDGEDTTPAPKSTGNPLIDKYLK